MISQVLGTPFHAIIHQLFIEAHYVRAVLCAVASTSFASPPHPWWVTAVIMPTLQVRKLRCGERAGLC